MRKVMYNDTFATRPADALLIPGRGRGRGRGRGGRGPGSYVSVYASVLQRGVYRGDI